MQLTKIYAHMFVFINICERRNGWVAVSAINNYLSILGTKYRIKRVIHDSYELYVPKKN